MLLLNKFVPSYYLNHHKHEFLLASFPIFIWNVTLLYCSYASLSSTPNGVLILSFEMPRKQTDSLSIVAGVAIN